MPLFVVRGTDRDDLWLAVYTLLYSVSKWLTDTAFHRQFDLNLEMHGFEIRGRASEIATISCVQVSTHIDVRLAFTISTDFRFAIWVISVNFLNVKPNTNSNVERKWLYS